MNVKKMTKADVLATLITIRMAFDSASKNKDASVKFKGECDKVWNYLHRASNHVSRMDMEDDDIVHTFKEMR